VYGHSVRRRDRPSLAALPALLALAVLGARTPAVAAAATAEAEPGRMIPPGVPLKYIHYSVPSFETGDPAPDFTLPSADGSRRWHLADLRGRPVALVFGSLTDNRFRSQAATLARIRTEYAGRVEFLVVAIREAHALDEWVQEDNENEGVGLLQPATDAERLEAARKLAALFPSGFPVAVDGLDDAAMKAYGAWPCRLFLVDPAGRVVFRGKPGPAGFKLADLRDAIAPFLSAPPAPEPEKPGP
jgi:hypothetical protein